MCFRAVCFSEPVSHCLGRERCGGGRWLCRLIRADHVGSHVCYWKLSHVLYWPWCCVCVRRAVRLLLLTRQQWKSIKHCVTFSKGWIGCPVTVCGSICRHCATTSDITLAIGQCTNGCFFQVCLCKKMHYLCDAAWPNQSIRGQEVEFLRMEGRKQLNFPNPSSAELQGFSWKLEVRCDTVSRTLFVPIRWAQSCHSVTKCPWKLPTCKQNPTVTLSICLWRNLTVQ